MIRLWTLVGKDCRRLAWPVGFWLACVGAAAVWFRHASPGADPSAPPDVVGWLAVTRIWAQMTAGVQYLLGFLLAGACVIEDPVVGADAFWMTRPIGRWRLLGAKFITLLLLFVVAPVAVSSLAAGGASGASLLDLGVTFGSSALAAFVIGSVSRSLAQFLLGVVAVVVGWFVASMAMALAFDFSRVPSSQRSDPPYFIPGLVAVGCVAAILIHQYGTRRTGRSRGLLAGAVILLTGVSVAAPFLPEADGTLKRWAREDVAVTMAVKSASIRANRWGVEEQSYVQANLELTVAPTKLPNGLYVAPGFGFGDITTDTHETVGMGLERGGQWGREAAREFVLKSDPSAMSWWLFGTNRRLLERSPTEARMVGRVGLWLVRPRLLGEFRPERGAGITGSSSLRVLSADVSDGWDRVLVVEERDSTAITTFSRAHEPGESRLLDRSWVDVFILLNRAQRRADVLNPTDMGSAALNNRLTSFRRLHLPEIRSGEEWRRDAVIAKVRLELVGSTVLPF